MILGGTVHLAPGVGKGLTGCCQRPVFELPPIDGVAEEPAAVTCQPVTYNPFDGYHTLGELYAHRRALTAALAAERSDISWRSRRHHPDSDPMFEGHFIVGIDTPAGPVNYHYRLEHWDDFANVPTVEHAPPWDGAPAAATVERLLAWARGSFR